MLTFIFTLPAKDFSVSCAGTQGTSMDQTELTVKQLLIEYFRNQSREFSSSFIACQRSINRGNIHALRLSLKNLHALFLLLNILNTRRRRKPSFPTQLDKLFEQLGKIRDLQIMEKELQYHEIVLNTRFRKLKTKLKKQQSERTENIRPVLKNLKFGIEINKIADWLQEVVSLYEDDEHLVINIRTHLLKSWKQILVQLKHKHTQKNLHLIRIHIKHLGSMTSVIKQEQRLIFDLPFRLNTLDEFQELLGSWHDQAVFYNKIKGDMARNPARKQMKLYFLLGSIKKKRGRMSRRVSIYCARILKKPPVPEKTGSSGVNSAQG